MILKNINQMVRLAAVLVGGVVITACSADFDNPVGDKASSSGSADLSKFVAIGDSLTAGYADGALYLSGQENSFPAVLAQQFAKAGGGSFNQPLVSDNLGGLLFGGVANPDFGNRLVLNADPDPDVIGERPSPEPIVGDPAIEVIGSGLNGTAFTNMGVPGAKSFHLLAPGYGNPAGLVVDPATANPYFVRFSSDITSATATVIGDAAVQLPSFFTLWIGHNDVLGYATSGGDDSDPITPTAMFDGVYAGIVATINTADNKGILINIPDVSTIPYFTTVPFNPVPLDQANVDALNAAYAAYNGGVQAALGLMLITDDEAALRTISFAPGQNAVVILDEDLTDITAVNAALINLRQANANDLIVLPASALIGTEAVPGNPATVHGLGVPLADKDVLIPSEIEAVNTARLAYNATIKAAADADENLIFFDVAVIMATLSTEGVDYGTGFIDATYATGGGFSLDGVHPTARGYAVIANSLIDAINTGFGASILKVDPGARTTVFFK